MSWTSVSKFFDIFSLQLLSYSCDDDLNSETGVEDVKGAESRSCDAAWF